MNFFQTKFMHLTCGYDLKLFSNIQCVTKKYNIEDMKNNGQIDILNQMPVTIFGFNNFIHPLIWLLNIITPKILFFQILKICKNTTTYKKMKLIFQVLKLFS